MGGQVGGDTSVVGPDPGRPYITIAMNWASSLRK